MDDVLYTHQPSGTIFNLRTITQEQLVEFFTEQSKHHIANGTQEHNSLYLNTADDVFTLTIIAALLDGDTIAGFCIIPKYDTSVLMRVYVSPAYRRMGIASFLITHYQFRHLSCLRDNINALTMYKKLGFIVKREHTWVLELERPL